MLLSPLPLCLCARRALDEGAWRQLWEVTQQQLHRITGRDLPTLPAAGARA
jgi:hypothetical protein